MPVRVSPLTNPRKTKKTGSKRSANYKAVHNAAFPPARRSANYKAMHNAAWGAVSSFIRKNLQS